MSEEKPREQNGDADQIRKGADLLYRRFILPVLVGCVVVLLALLLFVEVQPGPERTILFVLAATLFLLFFSLAVHVAKGKVHFRKRDETEDRRGDM